MGSGQRRTSRGKVIPRRSPRKVARAKIHRWRNPMSANLCITIRFLQPYCHGRGSDGDPEWPPSPLRVFQALVAAAAARWNERIRLECAHPALRWLERQPAPMIVAAPGIRSDVKYRLYVPDNVADKVARSWSGGREATIAEYRTEKDVCLTRL